MIAFRTEAVLLIEKDEPIRITDRTEMEEPRLHISKVEQRDARRMVERTETELPKIA